MRACEQAFESAPSTYRADSAKVLLAKSYCAGEAQDLVYRRISSDPSALTWEELKQLLRSMIAPEYQRKQDAAHAYHSAKQRKDQTVNSFISYVEGLEESMPEIPEAARVAHLKQAIKISRYCSYTPIPATTWSVARRSR